MVVDLFTDMNPCHPSTHTKRFACWCDSPFFLMSKLVLTESKHPLPCAEYTYFTFMNFNCIQDTQNLRRTTKFCLKVVLLTTNSVVTAVVPSSNLKCGDKFANSTTQTAVFMQSSNLNKTHDKSRATKFWKGQLCLIALVVPQTSSWNFFNFSTAS